MSARLEGQAVDETEVMPAQADAIRVRYWAAARSAAGVSEDLLATEGSLSLAEVRRRAVELHPAGRLAEVLSACSALVGDRPVGKADPDEVQVEPGDTVEFLPPFAGG